MEAASETAPAIRWLHNTIPIEPVLTKGLESSSSNSNISSTIWCNTTIREEEVLGVNNTNKCLILAQSRDPRQLLSRQLLWDKRIRQLTQISSNSLAVIYIISNRSNKWHHRQKSRNADPQTLQTSNKWSKTKTRNSNNKESNLTISWWRKSILQQ